jgi:hypothetical protein
MSSDGGIDETFFLREFAIGNGEINLLHSPVFELPGQLTIGFVTFGDDHNTGSIFIQTVHDAWPQYTIGPRQVFAMVEEGID